jgi:hypothetical protein
MLELYHLNKGVRGAKLAVYKTMEEVLGHVYKNSIDDVEEYHRGGNHDVGNGVTITIENGTYATDIEINTINDIKERDYLVVEVGD